MALSRKFKSFLLQGKLSGIDFTTFDRRELHILIFQRGTFDVKNADSNEHDPMVAAAARYCCP